MWLCASISGILASEILSDPGGYLLRYFFRTALLSCFGIDDAKRWQRKPEHISAWLTFVELVCLN